MVNDSFKAFALTELLVMETDNNERCRRKRLQERQCLYHPFLKAAASDAVPFETHVISRPGGHV